MRACVPATWALLTRASSQPCHMQLPFSSSSEQSTVTCSKKKNTPSAMLLERKQVLCSSCNQHVSANAFSRYHLNRHFAAKHPLVCQACQKDGCTFRNHHRYQCTEPSCGRLLGCKAFKRNQLYKYLKKKSTRLVCISCAETETFTCKACNRRLRATVFDAKQLQAHVSYGQHLVCPTCQQDGCTSKDPRRYRCTGPWCGKSFGRKAFDRKKMHSHIKRNTHLLCQTCLPKLQSLQAKAKASDQKRCICRRRAPSETCPMHGKKTRQYPWCDVMQAEESLWLQEHLASKRRKTASETP